MNQIEDLVPEAARAIVDPALAIMAEAVNRYQGHVAQSTGAVRCANRTRRPSAALDLCGAANGEHIFEGAFLQQPQPDRHLPDRLHLGFLGFRLDWEHRFGDGFPLYGQVSRSGLTLHLSGHHGDASPGSTVFVTMQRVREYQSELAGKDYTYMKPNIEELAWGMVMTVTDPFSNRIRFCEPPSK